MSRVTLELHTPEAGTARWATIAFVASYSLPRTRPADSTQLRLWQEGCAEHQMNPRLPADIGPRDRRPGQVDR